MFEDVKTLIKAALGAVRKRFEPLEADVASIKTDLAEVKDFMDALRSGDFDDVKSLIAGFSPGGSATASPIAATDPSAIATTIPGATTDHVAAALDAHAAELASGIGTPMTAQTAATQAAAGAGADPTTASAIGAAVAAAGSTPVATA